MKALILAAGRGTRIESVAHGVPKCLLSFGDRAILDCQIEALWGAGISEIGIVTGHNRRRIVEHVARVYGDCLDSFRFINNPWYRTTNNIYSLWLARDWVEGGDFVCLNADVLLHPDILAPAIKTAWPVSMIVDPDWRDETMKVVIRDGNVLRMSKAIGRDEYSGTYIGITTFARRVTGQLFSEIDAMLAAGEVNQFFNAAVQRLVDRGLPVGFTSTRGLPWAEVDDPNDLQFAETSVYPLLPRGPWAWNPSEVRVPVVA